MMATRVDILGLIADRRARRPARTLLALDALFNRLAACGGPDEALRTEDRIWDAWMHHPHRAAAEALDLATRDIAARRYDIAETRLSALLRSAPDFAEAWHKRARSEERRVGKEGWAGRATEHQEEKIVSR